MKPIRVFIIVDNDRFFIPDMLEELLDCKRIHIVGIGLAKKKYSTLFKTIRGFWKDIYRKITIFGLNGFFILFLKLMRREINNFFLGKPNSSKEVAKKHIIKYVELIGVNSINSIKKLKEFNIDLIVSAQDQIFKSEIINLPKIGCINKHAALLPKYRGVWPIFWAMLNDEKKIGLTIHWLEEGIDTGKIISQRIINVEENDSMFDLYGKVFDICSDLIIEAITKISKNHKFGTVQPLGNSSNYFSFPTKEDVKMFKISGKRLL